LFFEKIAPTTLGDQKTKSGKQILSRSTVFDVIYGDGLELDKTCREHIFWDCATSSGQLGLEKLLGLGDGALSFQ
jgi:hypothetical protein